MEKNPKLVLLGKQIRKLREEAEYSQEDFATEAGLDRSYFGAIERGERNIASINLIQIATALNVEVGELFPALKSLKKAK